MHKNIIFIGKGNKKIIKNTDGSKLKLGIGYFIVRNELDTIFHSLTNSFSILSAEPFAIKLFESDILSQLYMLLTKC